MKKKAALITSIALAAMVCTNTMSAQVPVYHVQNECGKIGAYPVSAYPPLSTTMPLNVIYGYIVMDSLCRVGSESLIDSLLSTISSDTLSRIMRYYYDVIDYDPILFMEYARASSAYEEYRVGIPAILKRVLDAYSEVHEYEGSEELFIWTNYIYRVRVNSQSSTLDSTSRLITRNFCANVTVLDKIKGSILPDPSRETYSGGESGEGFMNIWWGQVEGGQPGVSIEDTSRYNAVRHEYLVPGYEYLVFIDADPIFISETEIGYLLCSSMSLKMSNSFAFPMQSGNVIDNANYFELGNEIPYSTIVQWIRSARNEM